VAAVYCVIPPSGMGLWGHHPGIEITEKAFPHAGAAAGGGHGG